MEQGHNTRSADGYRSGIRRVNDEFFVPVVHKDMFDVLDHTIANGSAVDWLMALIGTISARIEQTDDVSAKKRLQDNRSQLKRFIEYISVIQDLTADSGLSGLEIVPEILPDGNQFYTHDTLIYYIVSRLAITDFVNADAEIFLPLRILGRLYAGIKKQPNLLQSLGIVEADGKTPNLSNWYRNWLKQRALNIVFHTAKGNYTLKEITGLLIDTNRHKVWIRSGGKDIPLLTDTSDSVIREADVTSTSDLRILPTESMKDILQRLAPVLTTLRGLTDYIKETFKDRTVQISKFNFNRVNDDDDQYYTIDVKLDEYLPKNINDASRWFCDNVDWQRVAPMLSLLRIELDYIAAATHLVVKADNG